MIRKILTIAAAVLLTVYAVLAVVFFTDRHEDVLMCQGIDLVVSDSLDYSLISRDMIVGFLDRQGVNPENRKLAEIDTERLEEVLAGFPLVEKAECYVTSGNRVKIEIVSKVPLVRVRNNRGQDFYVDSHGNVISQGGMAVHVPVATGNISREYAGSELLKLVRILGASDFWNAQVEQINITDNGEIQLVPRVGNCLLVLGNSEKTEEKLDRLMSFYRNGLEKIGWNKYASISVAFDNQVVCKRRK